MKEPIKLNVEDLDAFSVEIELMSNFFKMLADPTRLRILLFLGDEEICVNDIASGINMTKSAVSHQLALLRTARLIKNRKVGKEVYYSLADEHVKVLIEAAFEHVNEK
ncbi:DNA-binding transcriptional ArsR family regulator [Anaeroplasma bactoclasticum]|jgi:DNA-binding transcriptional ArsR family regulator|uniref:DNA-binding transcriptional ArsR family regulator n=1 Tax=Anaeroplasma bactoclasticum TaxID=2088 RepID=A0A397RS62_9MOLU|nr:metalloregulator ArsR/SmtB family transcription factor [Anaeroplasma bactoclasticum]RIA75556.1 DNA-binding transcriptional ArsR family regulator [Anaeroplasma bactoclasticum]